MNTEAITEAMLEPLNTAPIVGDRVVYMANQWTFYRVVLIAFCFQFPIRILDTDVGIVGGVIPDYFDYSGTGNDWRIFKRKAE